MDWLGRPWRWHEDHCGCKAGDCQQHDRLEHCRDTVCQQDCQGSGGRTPCDMQHAATVCHAAGHPWTVRTGNCSLAWLDRRRPSASAGRCSSSLAKSELEERKWAEIELARRCWSPISCIPPRVSSRVGRDMWPTRRWESSRFEARASPSQREVCATTAQSRSIHNSLSDTE